MSDLLQKPLTRIGRGLWLLVPLVPKGPAQVKTAPKSGILMRFLAKMLYPFVGDQFLTGYWTTIGETIYHPVGLNPEYNFAIMRHEEEHIRQFHKWGFLFPLLYVFALPVGFNPFRFWWELQAYRISMEYGMRGQRVIDLLSGSAYGWCMPRFVVSRIVQSPE